MYYMIVDVNGSLQTWGGTMTTTHLLFISFFPMLAGNWMTLENHVQKKQKQTNKKKTNNKKTNKKNPQLSLSYFLPPQ